MIQKSEVVKAIETNFGYTKKTAQNIFGEHVDLYKLHENDPKATPENIAKNMVRAEFKRLKTSDTWVEHQKD